MGTPESGMPSDAFRTGAHVTLAPVRIWHASRNKRASSRAKSRGCEDANTAQPVLTSLLTKEPS
jgi:hypothetical protein